MSKLACPCGYVLSDAEYPSPTQGSIVRQQDEERIDNAFTQAVSSFLAALREGTKLSWLRDRFGDSYPPDASDAEVISDLLSLHAMPLSVSECDHCGRLLVQREPGVNEYVAFMPENETCNRILASKR